MTIEQKRRRRAGKKDAVYLAGFHTPNYRELGKFRTKMTKAHNCKEKWTNTASSPPPLSDTGGGIIIVGSLGGGKSPAAPTSLHPLDGRGEGGNLHNANSLGGGSSPGYTTRRVEEPLTVEVEAERPSSCSHTLAARTWEDHASSTKTTMKQKRTEDAGSFWWMENSTSSSGETE